MMEAQEEPLEPELDEEAQEEVAVTPGLSGTKGSFTQLLGSLLLAVGLGQFLSLLVCGTAVTSGLLQQQSVFIPTAQSFLNYALLCMCYTTALACRRGEEGIIPCLRQRGWKYLLLGFIDVEANYLVVKAYHYTTVTSVQLLDCFTIPVVLVLSWAFLRVRYKLPHVLGVLLCLLGVGSLILADVLVEKWHGDGTNKLLGDMLCLAGAMLYGISNVSQEFAIRNFNKVEFLGMLGLFGTFINGIQFAILERQELMAVDFTSHHVWLPLVGFALCLFLFYSMMPTVLQLSSAASVNLNLLSADFYALLVGLFLFHYKFHILYFVSFGLIITGVVVYSVRPVPTVSSQGDYREMCTEEAAGARPSLGEPTEITYHTTGRRSKPANGGNAAGGAGTCSQSCSRSSSLQVAKFQTHTASRMKDTNGTPDERLTMVANTDASQQT